MHIAPDWLTDSATQTLMAALSTPTAQARFVGGCVRDAVLGRMSADIDLAINVTPQDTQTLLAQAGIKCIPTGIEHGTVTAVIGRTPFEVTSLREDIQTDGRHAVVTYTDDWTQDARRRDFTMNALYADGAGQVFDPLGSGVQDALDRRVRFIGTPTARIQEDYLRIMRFYRFASWYAQDGHVDAEGHAACQAHIRDSGFARLSSERITVELRKLLQAPDPYPVLGVMRESGVLGHILNVKAFAATPFVTNWLHRLALISDDTDVLTLSKAQKKQVDAFQQALNHKATPRVLAHLYGVDIAKDILTLRGEAVNLQALTDAQNAVCPVTAQDLMAQGYTPGKALGDALKQARQAWLDNDLRFKNKL